MPPATRSATSWSIVKVVRSAGQLTWLCLLPVPWGRDSGNEIAGTDRCRGAASGRPTSREACSSRAAWSTFVGSVHRDLGRGRLEHPEASLDGLLDPLPRDALLGELSAHLEGRLGQDGKHLGGDLGPARHHGVLVVDVRHRGPETEGATAVAPQPVVERALEDDRQEPGLVGPGHDPAEREPDLVAVGGGQGPADRVGLHSRGVLAGRQRDGQAGRWRPVEHQDRVRGVEDAA
jgi:hypothetical protein